MFTIRISNWGSNVLLKETAVSETGPKIKKVVGVHAILQTDLFALFTLILPS